MIVDLRYVYVEYELWALEHVLHTIEPAIEQLAQQNEEATLVELEAKGWIHDDAERQFAYQNIDEIRDYVLPRLMRGPYVVALWAAFESAVKQIAWRRANELHVSAPLESRGQEFPKRARKYFADSLALALDENRARYDRLVDLYVVRNVGTRERAEGRHELPGMGRVATGGTPATCPGG